MTTDPKAFLLPYLRGLTGVRATPEPSADAPLAVMDRNAERMLLKGNAKARRRWRRRNIPNAQRTKP